LLQLELNALQSSALIPSRELHLAPIELTIVIELAPSPRSAAACGANLLVMGSYGHSAQHDLLPGSTTSRLLRISPVPLLIAH
jgi:nucleotide-binding universal stress UspA family protein